MAMMKAVVIRAPGGTIETRPVPLPRSAEVLSRVKAFGLNHPELFTRQGLSPRVGFPRVRGIEAVGLVGEARGAPA